jgi:hypothetical protein
MPFSSSRSASADSPRLGVFANFSSAAASAAASPLKNLMSAFCPAFTDSVKGTTGGGCPKDFTRRERFSRRGGGASKLRTTITKLATTSRRQPTCKACHASAAGRRSPGLL